MQIVWAHGKLPKHLKLKKLLIKINFSYSSLCSVYIVASLVISMSFLLLLILSAENLIIYMSCSFSNYIFFHSIQFNSMMYEYHYSKIQLGFKLEK